MSESVGTARQMELRWTGEDSATLSIGDVVVVLSADEVAQLTDALFPRSPATRGRRHIQCLQNCLDELHATDVGARAYDLAQSTDRADLDWLDLRLSRPWDRSVTQPNHRARWPEVG